MEIQKKTVVCILQFLSAFLVSAAASMALIGRYVYNVQGIAIVIIAIAVSLASAVLLWLFKVKDKCGLWSQFMPVALTGALPVLSSVLFNSGALELGSVLIALGMYLLLFVWIYMLVLQIGFGLFFRKNYDNGKIYEKCSVRQLVKYAAQRAADWVLKNKAIIAALLIIVLVRLPYIELLPRWDSGEYYYKFSSLVEDYRYNSIFEYLKNFRLCGHPTLAFCYIYMIGEVIFPKRIIGVSLVSIGLTVIAMWCIYKILLKLVKGLSAARAAVYTLILSMAPLLFSTATYFNPDYALAMFFVFALYGCIYKKPVIAGLATLMCVQTKETGLVLIGGLVIGMIVCHIMSDKKGWFINIFKDLRFYCIGIFCVIQLVYMKCVGGMSAWGNTDEPKPLFSWDGNGYNCFGINASFFVTKIKQQIILNFDWLAILIIIGCVIWLVRYYKRCRRNNGNVISGGNDVLIECRTIEEAKGMEGDSLRELVKNIICIAVPFFVLLAFSALYITASHARYNVIGDIMLYIIMFYFVGNVVTRAVTETETSEENHKIAEAGEKISTSRKKDRINAKYVETTGLLVFTALITFQCFWTIDPLTRLCFKRLDAVNTDIYHIGHINDDSIIYYGDGMIYNTQYQYIDRAYDKMLAEADYDPDNMDIILPTNNGCFVAGNVPMYWLNWDTKAEKRVFYENADTKKMSTYIMTCQLSTDVVANMKDEAIIVNNPFWLQINIEEHLDIISQWYDIGERKVVSTPQGSIEYYIARQKKM